MVDFIGEKSQQSSDQDVIYRFLTFQIDGRELFWSIHHSARGAEEVLAEGRRMSNDQFRYTDTAISEDGLALNVARGVLFLESTCRIHVISTALARRNRLALQFTLLIPVGRNKTV